MTKYAVEIGSYYEETLYAYDPAGMRVKKTVPLPKSDSVIDNTLGSTAVQGVTRYSYDGMNILYENDAFYLSGGEVNAYEAIIHPMKLAMFVKDAQGSVRGEQYDVGSVSRFEYSAYGSAMERTGIHREARSSGVGNGGGGDDAGDFVGGGNGWVLSLRVKVKSGVGYTGHYGDNESGLYYARARYYDPAEGRFLTTDPIDDERRYEAPGLNVYCYGLNNPTNYWDPDGRWYVDLGIIKFGVDDKGFQVNIPYVLNLEINCKDGFNFKVDVLSGGAKFDLNINDKGIDVNAGLGWGAVDAGVNVDWSDGFKVSAETKALWGAVDVGAQVGWKDGLYASTKTDILWGGIKADTGFELSKDGLNVSAEGSVLWGAAETGINVGWEDGFYASGYASALWNFFSVESYLYINEHEVGAGLDLYAMYTRMTGLDVGWQEDVGLYMDAAIAGPLLTLYADTGNGETGPSGQFDIFAYTFSWGEFAEGGGSQGWYIDEVWGYNGGKNRDAYVDEVEKTGENIRPHRIKDYVDEITYYHDYLLGRGFWNKANVMAGRSSRNALREGHRDFNPRQRHVLSKLRAFELATLYFWHNEDQAKFDDILADAQKNVEDKRRRGMYDDPSIRMPIIQAIKPYSV